MKKPLTTEKFIERSKKCHGERYDYSQAVYISAHTKVEIICKEHGVFYQTPNFHTRSNAGCPKCALLQRSRKRALTKEQFIEKSIKLHGDKYNYSKAEYKNAFTDVIIICKQHGEFLQTANDHMNGNRGCRKCRAENMSFKMKGKVPVNAGKNKSNIHDFIEKAHEIHNRSYDYSRSIYLKNVTKLLITCLKHGDFLQTPHDHLQGCGCPVCSLSKGELIIEKFLIDNCIEYHRQQGFPDLKSKSLLKFDFFLPKHNILIEHDGRQHFDHNRFFHVDKESFKYQKEKDQTKNQYCLENHIKLIRIPYHQFDEIEKILSEHLKKRIF